MIIIYFLIGKVAATFSDSCQAAINKLTYTITFASDEEKFQYLQPFIIYSSKTPLQFGDYDACQRKYQYALLTMRGQDFFIEQGVCITRQCSIEEINRNQREILLMLTKLTQINEFHLKKPLTKIPPVNYTTICIIFLITLLSLLTLGKLILNIWGLRQQKTQNQLNQIEQELAKISDCNQDENTDMETSTSINQNLEQQTEVNDILSAFSLIDNINYICSNQVLDENLHFIVGYKAIAFMIVVLGHQVFIEMFQDYLSIKAFSKEKFIIILIDCLFSVDVFFWVGGFLSGYVLTNNKTLSVFKEKGVRAIPQAFIFRLGRIIPTYFITLMFIYYLIPYLGSGPRWSQEISNGCSDWWINLTFNLIKTSEQQCMGWCWYLNNDIRMFLFSTLIIYIQTKSSRSIGKMLTFFALIISQSYGTYVSFKHHYLIPYQNTDSFEEYYTHSLCRAPPYYLGMFIGLLYRDHKDYPHSIASKPFLTSLSDKCKVYQVLTQFICYSISFGIFYFLLISWKSVLVEGTYFWPEFAQTLYWAFSRLIMAIGLTLLALPNMMGIKNTQKQSNMKSLNQKILFNPIFQFISKISFSAYLIHFLIIQYMLSIFYEQAQLNVFDSMILYIGNLSITIILATFLSLIVEIPVANLLKKAKD